MASRITVTQKGRNLQKEMLKDTKFELPPILNLNLSQSREKTMTQATFPTMPDELDESATLADNPFNSTITYTRSGYFGPKKKKIITYPENLSKLRPRYYPNYLRLSAEDYPNAHFTILTPDHPLKHVNTSKTLASPKNPISNSVTPSETYNPPELTTPHKLPIKYTHHTIFPLTRPDRPIFLKTQINDSKLNETLGTPQNGASSPIKIETSDNLNMLTQTLHSKRFEGNSLRQQEFQRTMYLDKTIVSDSYSGKIVSKYDDKKLDRMKDRHRETQKEFMETLKLVDEKYKAKISKYEENQNEASDFLREWKRNEELITDIKKINANENERFKQRIKNMHTTKYTQVWRNFRKGGVTATKITKQPERKPASRKVTRKFTGEFHTGVSSKHNGSIEENPQNLADMQEILPQTIL